MVVFDPAGFPDIAAGKAFNITWSGATGPIALTLLKVPYNAADLPSILGDSGTKIENSTVIKIASNLNSSSYLWQLGQVWDGYGQDFEMVIDDVDNYDHSGKFKITSPDSQTTTEAKSSPTSTMNAIPTTILGTGLPLGPTPSSTAIPTETLIVDASIPNPTGLPSGLSTGAKAGVGVGTVAGIALLLGLAALFFFFRKRKLRKAQPQVMETGGSNWQEHGKAELSAAPLQNAKIGEKDSHLSTPWTNSWRNTTSTAHERSELVGSVVGDNRSWRMSELEGSVVRGSQNRMASSDSIASQRSELEGGPVMGGHNRVVSSESVVSSLAASPRIGSSGLRRSELSPVGMAIGDEEAVDR